MKLFRYWIPVFLILATIFYFSSLPGSLVPKFKFLNFPGADKVAHFSIYAALGFLICRALTAKQRLELSFQAYRRAVIISLFFGALYGVSDEFHQSFVPDRSVEFFDLLADTLGAGLGALLAVVYRKCLLARISRVRVKT